MQRINDSIRRIWRCLRDAQRSGRADATSGKCCDGSVTPVRNLKRQRGRGSWTRRLSRLPSRDPHKYAGELCFSGLLRPTPHGADEDRFIRCGVCGGAVMPAATRRATSANLGSQRGLDWRFDTRGVGSSRRCPIRDASRRTGCRRRIASPEAPRREEEGISATLL